MRVRVGIAAALVTCALAPAAARAAEPIMKLADVHAGLSCTARSTIAGTAVSEFRIEVIDVLRGDPAESGARILFRASGPAVDATGIGPGFSGSPIYCADPNGVQRVVGAISESVGQYGNHVALATPIEQMLDIRPAVAPQARKATALLRSARPLASPLTVSGLSGPVRRAAIEGASRAGIPLLAAPSGPATPYPAYPLVAGSSVAAGLSSGDIALAAIGTVTYRDGDDLWAFGHPLDAAGRRSLPLLDAYVYSVIDNPLALYDISTYKLASAGRPVGTLTTDGLSAIAGRVGAPPATIPLSVFARDRASGRRRTVNVDVADERSLNLGSSLDLVGSFAAGDAMTSVLRAAPNRVTSSMCFRAKVRQRVKPLSFCKSYFDAFSPLDDLSSAFGLIDRYKFGPLGIRDVSVRMGVRAGVREAFILHGRAPLRVRRGQRIRVGMLLRHSRAGKQRLSFRMRVPRSLEPGPHLLTLRGDSAGGGMDSLSALFGAIFSFDVGGGGSSPGPPRSVGQLAARIHAIGGPRGVRASFAKKRRGPVVYRSKSLLIRGKAQIPVIVRGRRSRASGYVAPDRSTLPDPPGS